MPCISGSLRRMVIRFSAVGRKDPLLSVFRTLFQSPLSGSGSAGASKSLAASAAFSLASVSLTSLSPAASSSMAL